VVEEGEEEEEEEEETNISAVTRKLQVPAVRSRVSRRDGAGGRGSMDADLQIILVISEAAFGQPFQWKREAIGIASKGSCIPMPRVIMPKPI
jgi:hypothetical protein